MFHSLIGHSAIKGDTNLTSCVRFNSSRILYFYRLIIEKILQFWVQASPHRWGCSITGNDHQLFIVLVHVAGFDEFPPAGPAHAFFDLVSGPTFPPFHEVFQDHWY